MVTPQYKIFLFLCSLSADVDIHIHTWCGGDERRLRCHMHHATTQASFGNVFLNPDPLAIGNENQQSSKPSVSGTDDASSMIIWLRRVFWDLKLKVRPSVGKVVTGLKEKDMSDGNIRLNYSGMLIGVGVLD